MHLEQPIIEAVLADWTTAPVSERVRAGLRLLETLTVHPQDLDAELLASIRAAGLDDVAIEAAANVGLQFNFINRVADALDFPRLNPTQRRRTAMFLDLRGRDRGLARAQPSSIRGVDGILRPVEVEAGRNRLLHWPSATEPALREAVEAAAARWFGGIRADPQALHPALERYVERVARFAYKVTDDDFVALAEAGYSQPQLFDLTLVAAFGASVPALERLSDMLSR